MILATSPRSITLVATGLLAAHALAVSACVEAPESEAVSQLETAVQGGTLADGAAYDGVVAVRRTVKNKMALCSGSLIAPNIVVTARHCVGSYPTACSIDELYGIDAFEVVFGVNALDNRNPPQKVDTVVLPPQGLEGCGADIAILVLQEPVAVAPVIPRIDEDPVVGEPLQVVGFGRSNPADPNTSTIRRVRDGIELTCVEDCEDGVWHLNSFVTEGGVCQGDSGGPAFDSLGRQVGLASMATLSASSCSKGGYTRLDRYRAWIVDTTLAAAEAADIDAPLWALGWPSDPAYSAEVGASCSEDLECPGRLCLEGGTCSRPCNEAAACPDGLSCYAGLCLEAADMAKINRANGATGLEPGEQAGEGSGGGCSVARPRRRDFSAGWLFAAAAALAASRRRRSRD